jgi:DNA modification methylase
MLPHVRNGAVVDLFIDYRGMYALMTAAREAGLQHLCTAVWDKQHAGMGGLYRHRAEFILVTKWGEAPHINNVQLGKHGRNRSTVWEAPGLAGFGRERSQALKAHATPKPVPLLADAILDTSERGGVVLDPFLGSGSLLLAAHRTGRVGVGIELDPRFVDVAVKRMETFTGEPARHLETGLTFAELTERRREDMGARANLGNA